MRALDPLLLDALAGLNDAVVLFDRDAHLLVANAAFHDVNAPLRNFLTPGTSWDIFLREAEMQGALTSDACRTLGVFEADLLQHDQDVHHLTFQKDTGKSFRIRMNATSEGGFMLTQSPVEASANRTEAEREVEVLLSKVLEACPACLTMSRIGDGQIIYRSPAATTLLGASKSSFSHFAKREERADFITALLPDARVDDMRVTGLRADGTEFPSGISARLIDYRGEDVIVSNMEDLTGIFAVQAELAQQRSQVFQAEKMSALGELLAGVAHELNNPLSIIVGNTEILREDLEGTDQETRIDKLSNAAERCVKIVRSFLAMARQEPLNPKSTSVQSIADVALDAVGSLARTAGISIRSDVSDNLPELMVDDVQIAQVLINLLTNAIHAIEGSDVGDTITLTGFQEPKTNMVCITVSDNGPGVDDAIVTRIFDPLFTTKPVGKGTGVGLSLCHRVIVAHGGTIRYEPSSLNGAVFVIQLPSRSA
ncbi:MAG: PAS domain-containing sensor histidine kinase [Sulfitobacter sp.]